MRKNLSSKGFTITEVIVYTALFSIIFVVVSTSMLWFVNASVKAKAIREVLANARRAMETISREIKSAKGAYPPTGSSAQISLEILNYLPTGEDSSYLDIYRCGSSICVKKEGQNPEAITSNSVNVTDLVFVQTLTGFQISLTVSYNNPSSRPEYRAQISLSSTASFRGY